ncbi:transglutaminase-like cysteine peptidase [Pseudomonas sp. R5(2019)]|uniref:transglutaminase-like cysteine peptidase n=1 Tax=Pseudomonas sp. R5(2019) TaxID=2697566 RepID=UPI001C498EEF|nr:transglutaminase-like cysteine peptidase [Pseudomonas sp. R5(2019)]NBA93372.1 hypothetical protein [Pseudomonas sp. R5(2019)]
MIGLYFLVLILVERRRKMLVGLLLSSGLIMGTAKATAATPSAQRNEQASHRLQDWHALIADSTTLSDAEKLQLVNAFFNRHIQYGEDSDVWGQVDYWASPLETLEQGAGDCEDFALAKYFTLRLLGVSEQSLRLVYTTQTSAKQAHMVLGYWSDTAAEPVLLDNITPSILPIAQRLDLELQFAFGDVDLYRFEHNHLQKVGKAERLPHWPILMAKLKHEGFTMVSNHARSMSPPLQLSAIQGNVLR